MDVHPPHHPIDTWRDFVIHLATITVGLLIALGLEGTVEWAHHRALVSEARANLREEITENRKMAADNLQLVHEDQQRINHDIETERALRDSPQGFHGRLQFTFTWSSMQEAAWNTARDTGALSYMAYNDVQHFADLYGQQQIVNAEAVELFREQTRAAAPVLIEKELEKLSKEDAARLLDQTATASIDLLTLEQTLTELRDQYDTLLKKL